MYFLNPKIVLTITLLVALAEGPTFASGARSEARDLLAGKAEAPNAQVRRSFFEWDTGKMHHKLKGHKDGGYHKKEDPSKGGDYGKQDPPKGGDYGKEDPPKGGDYGKKDPSKGGDYGNEDPPKGGDYGKADPPKGGDFYKVDPPKGGKYGKEDPPKSQCSAGGAASLAGSPGSGPAGTSTLGQEMASTADDIVARTRAQWLRPSARQGKEGGRAGGERRALAQIPR